MKKEYAHCIIFFLILPINALFAVEILSTSPSQYQTINIGQSISFSMEANDPYGIKAFEWFLGSTSKEYHQISTSSNLDYYEQDYWDNTFNTAGTFNVYGYVYNMEDPQKEKMYWWEIIVNSTNTIPSISRTSPSSYSITITQGTDQSFSVSASDPDGDLDYFEWYIGSTFQVNHSASESSDTDQWSYTFNSTGQYYVHAYIYDDDEANNLVTWEVNVDPSPIGSVQLSSPNGGESWTAGTTEDISWTYSGNVSTIDLQYTTDNGNSWTPLASPDKDSSSYGWPIPSSINSSQCKVKILGYYDGQETHDTSNTFTIESESVQNTIEFSGVTWNVRSGQGGPGPNNWSNSVKSIWVDDSGNLHLRIREIGGKWYATEIYFQQSLGYSEYTFYVSSNVDDYDPNVVVGLFTYASDTEEIDIEFSKWGDPENYAGWYVVQPSTPSSRNDFDVSAAGNLSMHRFNWSNTGILFQSYSGHQVSQNSLIHEWNYTGKNNPNPGNEKVHINFWLMDGNPPSNNQEVEVIIKAVAIIPLIASVQLSSPNGGENWTAGTTENISWTYSGNISTIDLQYTADNGNNWTYLASPDKNSSPYGWSIPSSINSSQCKIKILAYYNDHETYDSSNSSFTISPRICGDFNNDGKVDFLDFFLFADVFGQSVPPADPMFDLDPDNTIGLSDFFIFADCFGRNAQAKLIALAQQYIGLPESPRLEQNFPNPFNASTAIRYQLVEAGLVRLGVFDLGGQRVRSLVKDVRGAGVYEMVWDGTDEAGRQVSSGVYLVRLRVDEFCEVRKAMVVR